MGNGFKATISINHNGLTYTYDIANWQIASLPAELHSVGVEVLESISQKELLPKPHQE